MGPRRAAELRKAGILTVGDFLYRFPLRYEDRQNATPIASLRAGDTAAVLGTVVRCGLRPTRRRGFTIFELQLRDATGDLPVLWFNQRFLRDVFAIGQLLALFGKVEARGLNGVELRNPQYEVLAKPGDLEAEGDTADETTTGLHSGRIVPVYERIGTLTPKLQRRLVQDALDVLPVGLPETLPADIRARRGYPRRRDAIAWAHFPDETAEVAALNAFRTPAQQALVFEEFFAFQLGLAVKRERLARTRKPFAIEVDDRIRQSARDALPFQLTPGQKEALRTIVADMRRQQPMHRLLQGDVGSGKTIVALLAAIVAMENGLQVAFMAPTEILAEQHAATLARQLAATRFHVTLLTGRLSAGERLTATAAVASGAATLVVGTHALVQEYVRFKRLGLAIVDEQHRFGVLQRARLREKGDTPDVLVMTATPIPRTLALTMYGDLDVSVIRDRPPGRMPIRTAAKPEDRRDDVYAFVRRELEGGRQAYIVYPLVEESEKLDLRAATEMADHLQAEVFPGFRVALLHGRLAAQEKERVMQAFARGDVHLLVATTVVEVGVDVPNATVMIVEHADRFGLSQLHQLRGRVGRGAHPSTCVLLYDPPLGDDARSRLDVLTETTDGFVIAERDLALRGPGDMFGTRQWGMPALRVGDLVRDSALMDEARDEASRWVRETHPDDGTADRLEREWATRFGLVEVG